MVKTWSKVKENLNLTREDEAVIQLEYELLETLAIIRAEQGMTQAQLGKRCGVRQSAVARMESRAHSPQVSSLLKLLVPLGYTLKIVPFMKNEK